MVDPSDVNPQPAIGTARAPRPDPHRGQGQGGRPGLGGQRTRFGLPVMAALGLALVSPLTQAAEIEVHTMFEDYSTLEDPRSFLERLLGSQVTVPHPEPPNEVRRAALDAYRAHRSLWGEAPPIGTQLNGHPVVFWRLSDGSLGGQAGNYYPVTPQDAGAHLVCNTPGASGWCDGDTFSLHINRRALQAGTWALAPLFSHEMIHLFQRKWVGNRVADHYMPHWFNEGSANGWGYGLMERAGAQWQRPAIARATAHLDDPARMAFFLGLRYYDQPLDVDSARDHYPKRHPAYPQDSAARRQYEEVGLNRCVDIGLLENWDCIKTLGDIKGTSTRWYGFNHVTHAGYMTAPFFRHMLLGRPHGAMAVEQMMKSGSVPNTRELDAWLNWIDREIRVQQTLSPTGLVQVWPGGVRQIYTEMIAELADLPDLVLNSRAGHLEANRYDRLLWSQGCLRFDLETDVARTIHYMKLERIAARCLRVKPQRLGLTSDGLPLPERFIVTVTNHPGQDANLCADLQLVSRGQIMRNPLLTRYEENGEARCSIAWTVDYAPLNPDDLRGLLGDQTVLIVNAAERAIDTRTRRVNVQIVQPQVEANINARAVPENQRRSNTPRRSQLPTNRGKQTQHFPTPQRIMPPPDDAPCPLEREAQFECGEFIVVQLATGEMGQMMSGAGALVSAHLQHDPAAAMLRDLGTVSGEYVAQFEQAMRERIPDLMRGVTPPGTHITIGFPKIPFGTTGTFPAHIIVNWSNGEPYGTGMLDSRGPYGSERYPTGCVGGTPPSQATVTITEHQPGMLVGSAAARLYEENLDPASACTQPYIEAGTIELSFASIGVLPSDTRIDNSWMENAMRDELALIGVAPAISGAAPDRPGAPSDGSAPAQQGSGHAACLQPDVTVAFIEQTRAELMLAGFPPQAVDEMLAFYDTLPAGTLEQMICGHTDPPDAPADVSGTASGAVDLQPFDGRALRDALSTPIELPNAHRAGRHLGHGNDGADAARACSTDEQLQAAIEATVAERVAAATSGVADENTARIIAEIERARATAELYAMPEDALHALVCANGAGS